MLTMYLRAIMHLLGGNPANNIGKDLLPMIPRQRQRILAFLLICEQEFELIARWAILESLNIGSLQRSEFPVVAKRNNGEPLLMGSGRWLAADNGGDFALLRDVVRSAVCREGDIAADYPLAVNGNTPELWALSTLIPLWRREMGVWLE